jgi:hypothetical protein
LMPNTMQSMLPIQHNLPLAHKEENQALGTGTLQGCDQFQWQQSPSIAQHGPERIIRNKP